MADKTNRCQYMKLTQSTNILEALDATNALVVSMPVITRGQETFDPTPINARVRQEGGDMEALMLNFTLKEDEDRTVEKWLEAVIGETVSVEIQYDVAAGDTIGTATANSPIKEFDVYARNFTLGAGRDGDRVGGLRTYVISWRILTPVTTTTS